MPTDRGHPGLGARLEYRTARLGPSMYMPSMLSRPKHPVEPPALDVPVAVAASPNGRGVSNSARVTSTPHSTNPACSFSLLDAANKGEWHNITRPGLGFSLLGSNISPTPGVSGISVLGPPMGLPVFFSRGQLAFQRWGPLGSQSHGYRVTTPGMAGVQPYPLIRAVSLL
jgi:hypothetical protein